jgi:hypothetical protein
MLSYSSFSPRGQLSSTEGQVRINYYRLDLDAAEWGRVGFRRYRMAALFAGLVR